MGKPRLPWHVCVGLVTLAQCQTADLAVAAACAYRLGDPDEVVVVRKGNRQVYGGPEAVRLGPHVLADDDVFAGVVRVCARRALGLEP